MKKKKKKKKKIKILGIIYPLIRTLLFCPTFVAKLAFQGCVYKSQIIP